MFIGGLDIGTSGCKITVYDDKGNYIENHYKEYDSVHADGLHEIDAGEIVKAIKQVIGETENIPEALGITSFGETCVLLDKDDNILDNAMLYTDP
ncbi:MAG: carbohydrate kinase, partial [Ruminococcaceae bacterium]|nr:carbohydrate kinase [Oscillospiraceae bacterium]